MSRVFMIGWEYPPHNSGGLGVACQGLTQGLSQTNTQVYFTLPFDSKLSVGHMELIPCVDPRWSEHTQPPFSAYRTQKTLSNVYEDRSAEVVQQYAQAVAREGSARADSFEIIHAHDWMTFPAALELKKRTDKPFIAHIHSTESDRSGGALGNEVITQQEREGLLAADQVITVSRYTKQILVRSYGIDPKKISVVYNGVNTHAQHSLETQDAELALQPPTIVFMGRLTLQKGVPYFLALASRVLKHIPSALFVVAGSGDMQHELLLRTANQGLSASVVFTGFIRDVQKQRLLKRASVFVMPSVSEPFGIVALEAAAHQTPVIISKQSGVREVLPSAHSIDFWDLDKMTQAVVRLARESEYAQKAIKRHAKDLRKVTWYKSADQVRRIYRRAFLGTG